jgi:exodeoxyribonuclease-3
MNQIDKPRVRFDVRIATFNVNGVNGRLAGLLQWLEEEAPDVACLQELYRTDQSTSY